MVQIKRFVGPVERLLILRIFKDKFLPPSNKLKRSLMVSWIRIRNTAHHLTLPQKMLRIRFISYNSYEKNLFDPC